MINASGFLSNTTINIYKSVSSKTVKGGYEHILQLLYSDLQAKIEQKSVETPIVISGRSLFSYYLLHTWTDSDGNLYDFHEGDIVEDISNGKRYEVQDIKAGSLHKTKPYKTESVLLVMNDDRYTQFSKPL